jgi:hypothetical protein
MFVIYLFAFFNLAEICLKPVGTEYDFTMTTLSIHLKRYISSKKMIDSMRSKVQTSTQSTNKSEEDV